MADPAPTLQLDPLPYHRCVVGHLQTQESALWRWFSDTHRRASHTAAVRLDLLKSTYRIEREGQPKLYEMAREAQQMLGATGEVTIYQAQTGGGLNAELAYVPGEAHIIFSGPVTEVFSATELRSVITHELAHYQLWQLEDHKYLIALDMLRAFAEDPTTRNAAAESVRLYALWTEIFADRCACQFTQDASAAIAALLKVSTGLAAVNVESYLRQAEEIFSHGAQRANQLTHPELYIRARAIKLWTDQGEAAQPAITTMIEGSLDLNRLDLLGQKRMAGLTQEFLQLLLSPPWFRTETVLGHAKRFFADFEESPKSEALPNTSALELTLRDANESLVDYFCYLALDFATVDRDLTDMAMSAAIVLARRFKFDTRFAEIVHRELNVSKKAFSKIDKEAESLLEKTGASLHA